ncbi:MAG: 2Fe-2S iron-sulfur cluster binding domain-containing protein [Nitrospinae bacterium]|nr:2Fe-2S iron-sulfur cluster binding domain-containing protein [Nitrospinota bacterium]
MPKITLQNMETKETKTIQVGYGANLRKTVLFHEGEVYKGLNKFLNCRGMGMCGKCLVEVEPMENSGPRSIIEDLHKVPANQRLGCRAKVVGDLLVRTAIKD